MKVKDLIEILQKCNPESDVLAITEDMVGDAVESDIDNIFEEVETGTILLDYYEQVFAAEWGVGEIGNPYSGGKQVKLLYKNEE